MPALSLDGANRQNWRHTRQGKFYHWDQQLHDHVGMDWRSEAADRDKWAKGKGAFVIKAKRALTGNQEAMRESCSLPKAREVTESEARPYHPPPCRHFALPRVHSWEKVEIVILGDNQGVISQLQGKSNIETSLGRNLWRRAMATMEALHRKFEPAWLGTDSGPWAWIPREDNRAAVALANIVLDDEEEKHWQAKRNDWFGGNHLRLAASFDGASRNNPGRASAAAIVYVETPGIRQEVWNRGHDLGSCTNGTAEMAGALLAIQGITDILSEG